MVAGAADEPGPRYQQSVAHGGGAGLLARHLRLSILLMGGHVDASRREHLGGLIGAGGGMGGVDVAGGHVGPMPRPAAQRHQRPPARSQAARTPL